jgi:hypothetical protein
MTEPSSEKREEKITKVFYTTKINYESWLEQDFNLPLLYSGSPL